MRTNLPLFQTFFIDHTAKTTSFIDPRLPNDLPILPTSAQPVPGTPTSPAHAQVSPTTPTQLLVDPGIPLMPPPPPRHHRYRFVASVPGCYRKFDPRFRTANRFHHKNHFYNNSRLINESLTHYDLRHIWLGSGQPTNTVTYVANKDGYVPTVEYQGEAQYPEDKPSYQA